jgi:hypothetical protein
VIDKRTDFGEDKVLQHDVEQMAALAGRTWHRFPHQGFLEVCMRRWFRRVWIVQEGCLGREMMIICGRRSCSATEFNMAVTLQMLASSLVKPFDLPDGLKSDRDKTARHDAMIASQVASRLLTERSRRWRSASGPQDKRRGLANIVVAFNVDTISLGPWPRLEASNRKDHIYALRGLAAEDDPVVKAVEPDYTKTTEDIFTDFTCAAINPSIDILLLSQNDTKTTKTTKPGEAEEPEEPEEPEDLKALLPSWVPDWSAANLALPRGYRSGCVPIFSAGSPPGEPPQIHKVSFAGPKSTILRARGLLLCTIDRAGDHIMKLPPPPPGPRQLRGVARPTPSTIVPFLREVRAFCESAAERPGSASIQSAASLDEAVWLTSSGGHGLELTTVRSLMGPKQSDGRPLLGHLWDLQLELDVWQAILQRRRDGIGRLAAATAAEAQGGGNGWLAFPARLRTGLVYWAGRLRVEFLYLFRCYRFFHMRPFFDNVSQNMHAAVFGGKLGADLALLQSGPLFRHVGRRCIASGAGHVGLGPSNTQAKDLVVVLLGVSAPVILRPEATAAESFRYVGEAYCHGFMHGEALADGRGKDIRLFDIK